MKEIKLVTDLFYFIFSYSLLHIQFFTQPIILSYYHLLCYLA